MPSSSEYLHPAERSGTPDDFSGSDDDLDLEELDPNAAPPQYSRVSRDYASRPRNYGPGIALRNLRVGVGNKWKRSMSGHGEPEEDTNALLDNRDDARRRPSHASSRHTDHDVPLLNRSTSSRLFREAEPSTKSSRLRLPSFRVPAFLQGASRFRRSADKNTTQPPRDVLVGQHQTTKYPPNVVSNAKYTPWSFLPRTLYNEFSFFFNIYFLLVALSQIIPVLRIGYMSSYIAPLAFVVSISLGKEALDDIARRRRDAEANSEEYTVLSLGRSSTVEATKKSRDLKVGDVLKLRKNQRLPADVVILKSMSNDPNTVGNQVAEPVPEVGTADLLGEDQGTSQSNTDASPGTHAADDSSGNDTFIRTDQLDGETDWKLRLPSALSQALLLDDFTRLKITASPPDQRVNEFLGTIDLSPPNGFYDTHVDKYSVPQPSNRASPEGQDQSNSAPLTIDNTAWANTVLASSTITYAAIIYTGSQTRAALSTSPSRSKVGLLEYEINSLTKILCALTLTLSIVLVALEGFEPTNDKVWYVAIMIYLILFSTIIPMSLRVNLDMAKSVYGRFIQRDKDIPGTVVRTSTIPEDLGRIEYLLSDKTGTLTQNGVFCSWLHMSRANVLSEMELKKIHVGTVSYANEAMDEVTSFIRQGFAGNALTTPSTVFGTQAGQGAAPRTRREIGSRVRDIILALALCHNVTPTSEEVDGQKVTTYQASSPDEIAIVRYTEEVGLKLVYRDRQNVVLESTDSKRVVVRVRILDIFPFTSDSKRMGVIVQFQQDESSLAGGVKGEPEIWFYQKGADTVMSSIVAANDWLDEETANMAREGLRTLVVGRKRLSLQQHHEFTTKYKQAALSLQGRDVGMAKVVSEYLERNLELLGVTGVEDRLQRDVKSSLELLRNAGVKIWMLTGDKVETARCVAISAKLVSRGQYIHTVSKVTEKSAAQEALDFLRNKTDCCLLIDGESLGLMLSQFRTAFVSVAVLLPAVIACRCSPTQKAEVADLIRQHTKKRVCCIGDGGNDVSMIQAADVGIGIVGKEGRQASLAADFSITQFHHLTKLLVWHGRNSYKRSAKLAQFIMHRGLIISVCQTMYSIASHFDPKGLFINWLMIGYATIYTNAPIFSLVFDRDVDERLANLYPELYKELKTGKSLSYRSFFGWVLISVYQGAVIQGLSQILLQTITGPRLISVSFTALVLNELGMAAIAITTWHPVMIVCLLGTALLYAGSVPFLGDYFDLSYVITLGWLWRVAAVLAVSLLPVWAGKLIQQSWNPPSYRKNATANMTATRGHFGPLTTTFTPPSNCFNEKWVQYNTKLTVLRWGAACGPSTYGYDSACYPSGWSDPTSGSPNFKAFSPGLACPSGWTSAIDGNMIGNTKLFWLSDFVTSLGPHEVATACCPSGYGFNIGWCSKHSLTFSARPYISTSNNSCATTTVPFYNGAIDGGKTYAATFQARPIVLITDTRSSYIIPTATETASAENLPEGLSTGARIAIGVCIPVFVILAAAVLFIWLHRRRRARAPSSKLSLGFVLKPSRGDPLTGKPELETHTPLQSNRSELEGEGPPKEPAELSSWDTARAELPGNMPQVELPGDDVVEASIQKDAGENVQMALGHRHHDGGGTIPHNGSEDPPRGPN